MSVSFGEHDWQVIDAIDHIAIEGIATFQEIRWYVPGLPVQRLTGMEKRGLLIFNGREWAVTAEGRIQSEEYAIDKLRRA